MSSTVDSIEISSDKGMKIRISKTPSQRGTVQMAAPVSMTPMIAGAGDLRVTPSQGLPAVGAEAEGGAQGAGAPSRGWK